MLNASGQVALRGIVSTVQKLIQDPLYRREFDEWYRNTYGKEYVPERVYPEEKEVEEVSINLIREVLELTPDVYAMFREYLEDVYGTTVSEFGCESEMYQREVYEDFLQSLE